MKKMKKLLLAIAAIAISIGTFCTSVSAATRKCYTISSGNTTVYSNTGLTSRYGTIYCSDELTVSQVTGRYSKVTYNITGSGGRTKTGYIPTSAILTGVDGNTYQATARVTTYRRPGGESYGYVDRNDKVTVLGTSGNYTQIKYPVPDGYKYAFISTSDAGKYVIQNGSDPSPSPFERKIGQAVANINSYYYTSGNISYQGGYKGQCTWYAYGRFYEVNGIALRSARHAKYWLNENRNDGRVKISSSIQPKSIALRTSGSYGHAMFVEDVTYSNGRPQYVYFTECNTDGNGAYNPGRDCIVKKLSYSRFVSQKNPAGYIVKR